VEATPNEPEQHDWISRGLVPPRRLGNLLSDARAARGVTLEEVAERSAGEFGLAALASIERGTMTLRDIDLDHLAVLYSLTATDLIPARSKLVIDLDEGTLEVPDAAGRAKLPRDAGHDEVLSRYLAMVYSMRHLDPGTHLSIRVDDLHVLGTALLVGSDTIAADLDALMSDRDGSVRDRHALLRRKVLIPAAGILVATLGVGTLLLVENHTAGASRAPSAAATTAPTSATGSLTSSSLIVPVSVGTAVVQERRPDGTPGDVQVRGAVSDAPASVATSDVAATTIDATTATR